MTTPQEPHSLGDILRRVLLVDDAKLTAALARMQPGQKIGEALVEMGTITREQLEEALRVQEQLRSRSVAEQAKGAERMVELVVEHAATKSG